MVPENCKLINNVMEQKKVIMLKNDTLSICHIMVYTKEMMSTLYFQTVHHIT